VTLSKTQLVLSRSFFIFFFANLVLRITAMRSVALSVVLVAAAASASAADEHPVFKVHVERISIYIHTCS